MPPKKKKKDGARTPAWTKRKALAEQQKRRRGPETEYGLVHWEHRIAEGLSERDLMCNMMFHLWRKIEMCTHFSGLDCAREAFMRGLVALVDLHNVRLPPNSVEFQSTCDNAAGPIHVSIESSRNDGGHRCHFLDYIDRLPKEMQVFIRSRIIENKVTPEAMMEIRHQSSSIDLNWMFPPDVRAPCAVHDGTCPCYGGRAESRGASVSVASKNRPLRVISGGLQCIAFSTVGKQAGEDHISDVLITAWVLERKARFQRGQEDGFFFEDVMKFPAQKRIKLPLQDEVGIVQINTGPQVIGEPHLRQRVHLFGYNKQTSVWLGPSDDDKVQADFDRRFQRTVEMTGDAFMMLPQSTRRLHLQRLAAVQGHCNPDIDALTAQGAHALLMTVLPFCQFRAWEGYINTPACQAAWSEGKAFICDVEQTPSGCSSAGPDWPSQLTHGRFIASFPDGSVKIAHPLEHLQAMGWNTCSNEAPKTSLLPLLMPLSEGKLQKMCGNSMSLPVEAAWMLYCLAHLHPRDDKLPRSLSGRMLVDEWDSAQEPGTGSAAGSAGPASSADVDDVE